MELIETSKCTVHSAVRMTVLLLWVVWSYFFFAGKSIHYAVYILQMFNKLSSSKYFVVCLFVI